MKSEDLLIFEMGGQEFAMPLSVVEEVIPAGKLTAVPGMPPFFMGLTTVRGKIVGVINGANRLGLPTGLWSFFLICYVRGNLTAIAIDRAQNASSFGVEALAEDAAKEMSANIGVNNKFIHSAYDLFSQTDDKNWYPLEQKILVLQSDLFVSDEMASKVGEVA